MTTTELPVTAEDVAAAQRRIAPLVVRTPVIPSEELRRSTGTLVGLKLESLQPTGSFKVRGAASRMLALDEATARRGAVTASTGNHGRAVAHVARHLDVPATVCVSRHVPAGKLAALEELGCELVVGGDSQADALVTAERLAAERGATLVHPFLDPDVIAGQGSVGLELIEQRPSVTTVLVPLSGGGLLAGIAVALHSRHPEVRLVGVSMDQGAVMASSLEHGAPVEMAEVPTLADSLQGGIGTTNDTTFPIIRALVDDVILVSEDHIWEAMRFAFERHRLLLEGGGAVGIAALLSGQVTGEDVVVVCSGANAEPEHVAALARASPTPPPTPTAEELAT